MAQFGMNDTLAVLMRILNEHQEIIRLWHEVSALLQRLGLAPAQAAITARATHNFDVKWVQTAVNRQIDSTLTVDGVLGDRTRDAVKVYQGQRGLVQDGWPGPLTLAALEKDMSP